MAEIEVRTSDEQVLLEEALDELVGHVAQGGTKSYVHRRGIVSLDSGFSTVRTSEDLMVDALRSLVSAAAATMGECRLEAPYKPLRPVLTSDGLTWCCTHETQHCAG